MACDGQITDILKRNCYWVIAPMFCPKQISSLFFRAYVMEQKECLFIQLSHKAIGKQQFSMDFFATKTV